MYNAKEVAGTYEEFCSEIGGIITTFVGNKIYVGNPWEIGKKLVAKMPKLQ